MRSILLCLMLMPMFALAQPSFNMTLLSNWDDDNLPVRSGAAYNDCWGYRHANGTEVAIIGGTESIFFFNVTSPANPVLIYAHPVTNSNGTTNQSLWRDFKTYQNRAYASADEGTSGLLIFDLSQVPTSVTLDTQITSFFHRAHNIYIDEQNGRLYAAGSNTVNAGLKVLNLAPNPSIPVSIGDIPLNIGGLGGGYVHDVHVVNHIAYCSHGGLQKLNIYNMSNLLGITLLGSIANYPEPGYNHSSWVNPATNKLVMADETQGSDLKLVDITNPGDISADDITTFYSELLGPGVAGASLAHNPFIQGSLAYIAYYHDGVQVFNIANPNNIQLLAYYDTYPQNTTYTGYQGCWGVYPYLPSGIIIASDQTNGLFVMQIIDGSLDISFLSFEAKRKGEDVKLEWYVADAAFGHNFEVMRSSDNGITFETIGAVNLVDNQSDYSFLDRQVQPLKKYIYRIDFIELDGKKVQSPSRVITPGNSETTLRIVNPVISTLIVDVMKPIELLDLVMYNMEGRLVWSYQEDDPRARMELSISQMIPGQYILDASWPGGNEKMIIQVLK